MREDQDLQTQIETMSAIELITVLDKLYPERCIGPMDSLDSAHRYAGRREMINELVYMRDHAEA